MPRILSLFFPSAVLGFTWLQALSGERHLSLLLRPVADGHAHGHVELEEESLGGTYVSLHLHGLEPGAEYVSEFHHELGGPAEPEGAGGEIGRFVADEHGHAFLSARLAEPLTGIGSINVRVGENHSIVGHTASQ